MQLYLPIAEIALNPITLIFIGLLAGIVSGMFGIGGGFLIVPVLIFMGVSPAVALSSSACQTIASSFSGALHNIKKKNVDTHVGVLFFIGSICGSILGMYLFVVLQHAGMIDLFISLIYVCILGFIGTFLFYDGVMAIYMRRNNIPIKKKQSKIVKLTSKLPFRVQIGTLSQEYSVLIPMSIGFFIGIIIALSGISGGFILVPSMIYLLGMSTRMSIGTSSYQITLVTIFVTILHITFNHTVDLVLASILMIGAVLGVQLGVKLSVRVPPDELRVLLSVVILSMVMKLAIRLFSEPESLYILDVLY